MRKLFMLLFMAACSSILFAACSSEGEREAIDEKASFAVYDGVYSLAGTKPIGFNPNNMNIDWVEESYKEIQSIADPWLKTLKPTHQMSKFPLKKYLNIYYSHPNEQNKNIHLFIPYTNTTKAHKNIILEGHDNGKTLYYVFEGGEKETGALIDWMRDHEPK